MLLCREGDELLRPNGRDVDSTDDREARKAVWLTVHVLLPPSIFHMICYSPTASETLMYELSPSQFLISFNISSLFYLSSISLKYLRYAIPGLESFVLGCQWNSMSHRNILPNSWSLTFCENLRKMKLKADEGQKSNVRIII